VHAEEALVAQALEAAEKQAELERALADAAAAAARTKTALMEDLSVAQVCNEQRFQCVRPHRDCSPFHP
jgi:hypothetical protein